MKQYVHLEIRQLTTPLGSFYPLACFGATTNGNKMFFHLTQISQKPETRRSILLKTSKQILQNKSENKTNHPTLRNIHLPMYSFSHENEDSNDFANS